MFFLVFVFISLFVFFNFPALALAGKPQPDSLSDSRIGKRQNQCRPQSRYSLISLLDKVRHIDYHQYIMKLSTSCVGCFAGLSCSTRIGILNLLQKKGEISVMEIAKHFKLKQPTISHHLQYLKESGVLSSRKKGRQIFYFLDPKCKSEECNIFL